MKVGDLVKAGHRVRHLRSRDLPLNVMGTIVDINYPIVNDGPPDYRTPVSILVQFSELQPVGELGEDRLQQWYHKNDLELISEAD